MATRSNVGYYDPKTKKYHYVYIHWDGYLSHNGRILRDHYKSLKKVKELIALGDISSLRKNIKPGKSLKRYDYKTKKYVKIEKHTFETPDDNTTVAYHRDRGETYNAAKVSDSFPVEQEWAYCFIDGKWHFKCYSMDTWVEIPAGDLEAAQQSL